MTPAQNRRRDERRLATATVQVAWEDRGRHVVRARILDITQRGIRLEMPERIQVRQTAHVKSHELGISVNASVRHCNRAGNMFVIGMEFTGGVVWRPAA